MVPWVSAGAMISRTSWARAAAKSRSSVSAHISSPLELCTMMLRTCSPISVPPGSRVTRVSRPSSWMCSASSAIWVDLPLPSEPSNEMSFPAGFCFKGMMGRMAGSVPVGEEGFQIVETRAGGGAHVVAAGADAEREAALGVEAEQLAVGEAGVEVVAGAGGDERVFAVGAGNPDGAFGGGAGGGFARMHDDGGEGERFADGGGEGAQA